VDAIYSASKNREKEFQWFIFSLAKEIFKNNLIISYHRKQVCPIGILLEQKTN